MRPKLYRLMVPVLALAPSVLEAQDSVQTGARSQAQIVAEGTAAGQIQGAAAAQNTLESRAQGEAASPQARIESAMQAAAEARLPVSLLESKVAEGDAKRVPPERIAAAVEARLTALVHASQTLAQAGIQSQNAGELSVTVDALQAGVRDRAVIEVSRNAPAERRVVAIAILADLVRLGHDSEAAMIRVNGALTTNAELANLSAEVAADGALSNLQGEVASELAIEGLNSILDGAVIEGSGALSVGTGLDLD